LPATARPRIPRLRARSDASRSQPAQREQDEPAQHHQARGQQAEQKDVAGKCSHRGIPHAGGSEGTALERLGVALYPSAQSGNNPRKNGQAAPAPWVYCEREDGVSLSRPRNVRPQRPRQQGNASKDIAVEAQDRNHSRHHPPHPFFRKGGAMAGKHRQAARRRRIRGRRSARLSDAVLRGREIADVSAAEERNRVALGQEDGGARYPRRVTH